MYRIFQLIDFFGLMLVYEIYIFQIYEWLAMLYIVVNQEHRSVE